MFHGIYGNHGRDCDIAILDVLLYVFRMKVTIPYLFSCSYIHQYSTIMMCTEVYHLMNAAPVYNLQSDVISLILPLSWSPVSAVTVIMNSCSTFQLFWRPTPVHWHGHYNNCSCCSLVEEMDINLFEIVTFLTLLSAKQIALVTHIVKCQCSRKLSNMVFSMS